MKHILVLVSAFLFIGGAQLKAPPPNPSHRVVRKRNDDSSNGNLIFATVVSNLNIHYLSIFVYELFFFCLRFIGTAIGLLLIRIQRIRTEIQMIGLLDLDNSQTYAFFIYIYYLYNNIWQNMWLLVVNSILKC